MPKRNLQIDVLRGVAVMMVLAAHTHLFRPHGGWKGAVLRGSWSGVDLFFVLSGFLISGLLFSEYQRSGRIGFGRFAARRAMKLYPPLYLLITLALAVRLVQSRMEDVRGSLTPFLHDVFFVQSYLPGTYGHFWSLSVEEHFYVLLPLSLYFGLRIARGRSMNPFQWIPTAFLVLAVLLLAARAATWKWLHPYDLQTHHFPSHLRLDSLMFGVFLSYLAHFQGQRLNGFVDRNYWPVLGGSLLLLAPIWIMNQDNPMVYTLGFTLLYLGYGGLMMVMLRTEMPTEGAPRAALSRIATIGKHSYSIYLWHIPVLVGLQWTKLTEQPYAVALYFGATLGIGIGLSLLVDIPVLRLRDRLWPSRGAPVTGLMTSESLSKAV
jgi:peptidoglycan/LPS O-acetylase OafA/YrhL